MTIPPWTTNIRTMAPIKFHPEQLPPGLLLPRQLPLNNSPAEQLPPGQLLPMKCPSGQLTPRILRTR